MQDQLTQKLQEKLQGRAAGLKGWRVSLYHIKALEAGIKNNKFGGPYMAPGVKEEMTGEVYLLWEGSRFTNANINRETVEHFEQYWELWQKTAYHDPEGAELLPPQNFPDVKIYDGKISSVINEGPALAVEVLQQAKDKILEYGVERIDQGMINLYDQKKFIRNSAGLSYEGRSTVFSMILSADTIYRDSFSGRFWPDQAKLNKFCRHIGETAVLLKNRQEPQDVSTIVFSPQITEDLIDYYILTNLNGSLVLNGRSAFSRSDFEKKKRIWREDFSLVIDNTIPGAIGSYQCTSEGVPGGKIVPVQNGCLHTPILNVKYAQKLNASPTPRPANGGGFFLIGEKIESYEELLGSIKNGLIVCSILGLHTQDYTTGKFSLTADQCLLVKDGKITGKIKKVITGDIFRIFNQETTRLAGVDGEDNPAMAYEI